MANPFPNMTVNFETKSFNIDLTNTDTQSIESFKSTKDVSNYEYEVKKNDEKRKILVLKKEYLGAFISDVKNIMTYEKSSQFIDDKTKRV
jgi:hypothetical protein